MAMRNESVLSFISITAFAMAFIGLPSEAKAESFSIAQCISTLTKEVDKPNRISLAKAKARCAAVAVSLDKLRREILGSWRRIDENGKDEIQTFGADGIVILQRQTREVARRFKAEHLAMPFRVTHLTNEIGGGSGVVIDGSLHDVMIAGNQMHDSWMPASAIIETDWTRMPSNVSLVSTASTAGGSAGADTSVQDSFASYQDVFLTNEDVEVTVRSAANWRNYPTTNGTEVLGALRPGVTLKGRWVAGIDPSSRWLRINTGGYVWDGNLRSAAAGVDFQRYATNEIGIIRLASDDQAVWDLVKKAVGDKNILRRIELDTGASGPVQVEGNRLIFWGICQKLCQTVEDDFEYSIIITNAPTGQFATVCFNPSRVSTSSNNYGRWFQGGRRIDLGQRRCPDNLTEFPVTALITNEAIQESNAVIRLTQIPKLKNDHCYESLDTKGNSVVRYFKDDGMWTGINGKIYRFRMDDYLTGQPGIIEVSSDKSVRIKSDWLGDIMVDGMPITVRDLEVTMNGSKKTFKLYDICPAAAPSRI